MSYRGPVSSPRRCCGRDAGVVIGECAGRYRVGHTPPELTSIRDSLIRDPQVGRRRAETPVEVFAGVFALFGSGDERLHRRVRQGRPPLLTLTAIAVGEIRGTHGPELAVTVPFAWGVPPGALPGGRAQMNVVSAGSGSSRWSL